MPPNRTMRRKALLLALVAGALLGCGLFLAETPYHQLLQRQERAQARVLGERLGTSLGSSVNRRLALLQGLKAHVLGAIAQDDPEAALDASFGNFARGLHLSAEGIRNFIIAPGGVNTYVEPLETNRKAIGHDILHDKRPGVRRDVERALRTEKIALSGPYRLRQGGLGLVARQAVVSKGRLWGLVSMVLDMPPVLHEAGLESPPEGYVLGLRDWGGNRFHGKARAFDGDPVVVRVPLPEGYWELAMIPEHGWGAALTVQLNSFRALTLLVTLLAATLVYLLTQRHQALTEAVDQRTAELVHVNVELEREIALRGQTEIELQSQREFTRDIIDSMPSMIVGVAPDGRVNLWNEQTAQELGVSAEDAQGRPLQEVAPGLAEHLDAVALARRTGQTQSKRYRSPRDSGVDHVADVTVYPLSGAHEGAVIRVDDVSERVGFQDMMAQNERIVSLGMLAAGMAHEINNPLGGMLQNVQNVQRRLDPDMAANAPALEKSGLDAEALTHYLGERKIPDMLEAIRGSGQRVAQVVANTLDFSNRRGKRVADHDPREMVDKALTLASTEYGQARSHSFRSVRVERDYGPDVPAVPCVGADIEQVVLNLVLNAIQAIGAADPPVADPCVTVRLRHDSESVLIEVTDNGPGMPEEVRRNIFEPFFTTQDPGVGTGLGLSVSYFIVVRNHGGSMAVRSAPGQGTTFSLRLPLAGMPMDGSATELGGDGG